MLLLRNCLRVGTLQIIASAFIFLGKYFIALVVAIVSAIWMVCFYVVKGKGEGKFAVGENTNLASVYLSMIVAKVCGVSTASYLMPV